MPTRMSTSSAAYSLLGEDELAASALRFRKVSWAVIGLLVAAYGCLLLDKAERDAAATALDSLANFIDQGSETVPSDLPLHERAFRLAAQLGGVFSQWASRLVANRQHELEWLMAPGGMEAFASVLAGFGAAASGVHVIVAMRRWAQHKLLQRVVSRQAAAGERLVSLLTPEPRGSSYPNRVCNTRVLTLQLPLRPARVAAVKFAASLVLYFGQPDDFFFLFVAAGQIVETGSFRSCGPVIFFCAVFCFAEASAALRQARVDSEQNSRRCTVLRGDKAETVLWSEVSHGDRVRVLSGETPPCDLLLTRVHGLLRAREKDLTGESKPVSKHVDADVRAAVAAGGGGAGGGAYVRVSAGVDALQWGDGRRPLDSSCQLFRGTTPLLSPVDQAAPHAEGVAIRLGHQCKMCRDCPVAVQRPSKLLARMSRHGMGLVCALLFLAYDNSLTVFANGTDKGRSFAKASRRRRRPAAASPTAPCGGRRPNSPHARRHEHARRPEPSAIWGDMGRYGEIWGDMGSARRPEPSALPPS